MIWITTSSPDIFQLASSWLITRFVDQKAEIIFAPEESVNTVISETLGLPFDIEGVEFSRTQGWSAFERILVSYRFTNPALGKMAPVLRYSNALTLKEYFETFGLKEEAARLVQIPANDKEALAFGLKLFDALYNKVRESTLAEGVGHNIDPIKGL
ncbi:chromate resistance protein [bacterium]|nr:chromate resistance protein [bacterium]